MSTRGFRALAGVGHGTRRVVRGPRNAVAARERVPRTLSILGQCLYNLDASPKAPPYHPCSPFPTFTLAAIRGIKLACCFYTKLLLVRATSRLLLVSHNGGSAALVLDGLISRGLILIVHPIF